MSEAAHRTDDETELEDQFVARPPRPRTLAIVGLFALVVALAVAITGIAERSSHEQSLIRRTDALAVPTVQVIRGRPETDGTDLVLPGNIDAEYLAPIFARVPGYLKMWYKDIGARVKTGDVLAVIETPDLDQQLEEAKAARAEALAHEKLAEVTAQRWNHLLAANAVSQQDSDVKEADYEAARAAVQDAQARVDRINALENFKKLVAPFDGVVTARRTDVGDLINVGAGQGPPLFEVAKIDWMRVYVRVPQWQSAEIAVGMPATLHLPQYPKRNFSARVITTANGIDPASRTLLVELKADNEDGLLMPGTYAQVDFHLKPNDGVLLVPSSALVFRAHGLQLATVGADDRVVMKDIRLGRDLGGTVEVVSGISKDDRIINDPPDSLIAGEKVQVTDA